MIEIIPVYHPICKAVSAISVLFVFMVYSGDFLTLKHTLEFNGLKERNYYSYLQYPDKLLSMVSLMIVGDAQSDDEKAEKILVWVHTSFKYESDFDLYGELDKWVKPIDSLKIMKGDCEDGAFLIHSLLLHAGVNPTNIVTSGGLVRSYKAKNGKMIPNGLTGHAWTSYKRQSDGEWIALDWCNYDETKVLKEIKPLKKDTNYVSTFMEFNYGGELKVQILNSKFYES
jgi:hypothetical protein